VPEREVFHILLLRHGQTDANATGVLQGHLPTPLNSLGLRQAGLLAQRVARHVPKVTALVSSDLRRATQTAEPVAAACGLATCYDPSWRERAFGEFEGRHVGERDTWRAAHGDTDPPGAESLAAFRTRVRRALEFLPQRFPGHKMIAVITHGGPIGMLLRMLSDGSLPLAPGADRPDLVQAPNCSMMDLVGEQGRNGTVWRVACASDVAHLDDLITQTDNG
jgi:probable phosphoglycerate mutase